MFCEEHKWVCTIRSRVRVIGSSAARRATIATVLWTDLYFDPRRHTIKNYIGYVPMCSTASSTFFLKSGLTIAAAFLLCCLQKPTFSTTPPPVPSCLFLVQEAMAAAELKALRKSDPVNYPPPPPEIPELEPQPEPLPDATFVIPDSMYPAVAEVVGLPELYATVPDLAPEEILARRRRYRYLTINSMAYNEYGIWPTFEKIAP